MTKHRVAALVIACTLPSLAEGFDLGTHASITQYAVEKFVRDNPTKLTDLGTFSLLRAEAPAKIFGGDYLDFSGTIVATRTEKPFERVLIKRLGGEPLSILGWVMRGAIREDDGLLVAGPHDDVYFPLDNRFLNHFFDPLNNKPLTQPGPIGQAYGAKAPDWATGAVDAFQQANTPDSGRHNHFSIFDAQEALFRAITLKTRGSGGTWEDLATGSDASQRLGMRKGYWATTFRALGDIVHLVEDMAQPQHTRNELHSGVPLYGSQSFIEKYYEARATNEPAFDVGLWPFTTTVSISPELLDFQMCDGSGCADYPLPAVFTKYSDFWSTSLGTAGGKGLADYTNPNFFTAAKNLGGADNDYSSPPNDPAAGYVEAVEPATDWKNNELDGPPITFYKRDVPDFLNQGLKAIGVRLTGESIWDEYMKSAGGAPTFHLYRETYDDLERLLIPRAVSYSAGLLGYFFRGSMEISLPDEGIYSIVDHSQFQNTDPLNNFSGFGKIKLKLRNTSPPPAGGSQAEALSNGTLFAVLKFHRNTCYADDLSGQPGAPGIDPRACLSNTEEIVVSDPVPNAVVTDVPAPYVFNFPQNLPINATEVDLQVVYRGQLGWEADAVVVATKDISEPTFFTYQNASDYIHIGTNVFTRDTVNGRIDLLQEIRPQGLVDYSGTPKLFDNALIPIPFSVGLRVGDGPTPVSFEVALPALQYIRFAFLTDVSLQLPIAPYQTNPCDPHDPYPVDSITWQADYLPDTGSDPVAGVGPGTRPLDWPDFQPVRGVYGWSTVSCVLNGDNTPPGTIEDDRYLVMSILPNGQKAFAVAIPF